jgi:prevent-host-death family protein
MTSPVRTLTAAEAKASFAVCLRSAETGTPLLVTRHGRPVAAIIGVDDWKHVQRLRAGKQPQGLAGLAGGRGWGPFVESVARVHEERRARSRRRR